MPQRGASTEESEIAAKPAAKPPPMRGPRETGVPRGKRGEHEIEVQLVGENEAKQERTAVAHIKETRAKGENEAPLEPRGGPETEASVEPRGAREAGLAPSVVHETDPKQEAPKGDSEIEAPRENTKPRGAQVRVQLLESAEPRAALCHHAVLPEEDANEAKRERPNTALSAVERAWMPLEESNRVPPI